MTGQSHRAYLLGRLDGEARDAVEEALFTDPKVQETLRALEGDLVDEYLGGTLSAEDRKAFEARLETDEHLADKVRLQRSLAAKATAVAAPASIPWWRSIWTISIFGVATAAAAVALVSRGPSDEFGTKGGAEAVFRPRCEPACRIGGSLSFEVKAPAERPHLAAFGRRADGRIVWYEPSASKTSSVAAEGFWPRTFDIDTTHQTGKHEIFAVFSDRGLTRAQIAEIMGDDLEGTNDVLVVRREIEIQQEP